MAKLKLDLHAIYNKDQEIEAALLGVIKEAIEKRIELIGIIPGKGTGQLKKRVLRVLEKPEMKCLYFRLRKDARNYGRFFLDFRHKNTKSYHG